MDSRHPRLKRHFALIAHDPNVVEIRNGVWNVASYTLNDEKKTGKLFALLDGLDGTISAADLARREQVPRSEIEALIDHLIQLDIVEFGPSTSFDYYVDQFASPLVFHHDRSELDREVAIVGDEALGALVGELIQATAPSVRFVAPDRLHALRRLLAQPDASWLFDGLELERRFADLETLSGVFLVHVEQVVQPVRLQILNRLSLHHGMPWMQAAIDGPQLLIGPIVDPPHTPCFECFETRMLMNMRESAPYVSYKRQLARGAVRTGRQPMEAVLRSILAGHAAMECLNFLLTNTSFTRGKVLGIYLPTMEFSFNEVLKVPGCAACAPPAESSEEELHFDMRRLVTG
jgi:bacteriocin biosynthesis cyclodehydratase domain-containing protein